MLHDPESHKENGFSPAQVVFGRDLWSCVPAHRIPYDVKWTQIMNDIERKSKTIKENPKKYHDKGAQNLPPLKLGDNVLLQDPVTREWDRIGVIVSIRKHQDYDVKLSSGRLLWRNRKFLHKISDND